MHSAVIFHFSLFFFLIVTEVSKQNKTVWKREVTRQLAPSQHLQPALLGLLSLSWSSQNFLGLTQKLHFQMQQGFL